MPTDTDGVADCKGDEQERTSKKLLSKHLFVNRIMGQKDLSTSARVIAAFLMYKTNCEWETCWPGRQSIADDTGLSLRTVGTALRELRDAGWITWRERENTSSVYRFNWDREQQDDAEQASYVARDKVKGKVPPQELAPEKRAGKRCQGGTAKVARITKGRELGEDNLLSTSSTTREGERSAKSTQPSAEPLQEGSAEWWKERTFNHTGEAMRARFYPTQSKAAFKSRLAGTLKREKWDYPAVERAMRAAIEAEPALDAWEYVIGILRRRAEAAPDYRQPLVVRGVM